jgi:hypothetical protein
MAQTRGGDGARPLRVLLRWRLKCTCFPWVLAILSVCACNKSQDAFVVLNIDSADSTTKGEITILQVTVGSIMRDYPVSSPLPATLGIATSSSGILTISVVGSGSKTFGHWAGSVAVSHGQTVEQDVVLTCNGITCGAVISPSSSSDGGTDSASLPIGASCAADGDCRSGFCIDRTCCTTRCEGPCATCGHGFCMLAAAGTNPRGTCTDSGASQCGQTGVCDGGGACQIYPAGTICKDAACPVHMLFLASRCDGNGMCVPGQTQSCSPYLCGLDGKCLAECQSDMDCENGYPCMMMMTGDGGTPMGICGKKALGTQCAADGECDSTHCAQGVCCSVACNGGCLSCALMGNEGACTPVPAGIPAVPVVGPAAGAVFCQAAPMSTCGLDGTCDGAGACRLFPAGTPCNAASCASATLRNASTCDGKNHCQPSAAVTCGGYTCATVTTCKTTCVADTDCAPPSVCNMTEGVCGGL